MRIEGTQPFKATVTEVWAVLSDVDVVGRCTPGCKALRAAGPDQYEMDLELGVAAIKGKYTGKLELQNIRPEQGYELVISAQGAAGWLKGRWTLALAEGAGGAVLTYGGDADVGGLVASVGQRMLSGVAKMIMGQMFTALAKEVDSRKAQ